MADRVELARKLQEYLDDSGCETDEFIEGLDVTFTSATDLFNDFLLFLGDGEVPPVPVLNPCKKGGKG